MKKYISAKELGRELGVSRNKILAALTGGRIRYELVEVKRLERRIPRSELRRIRRLMRLGKWDWGQPGRPSERR